MSSSTMRDDLPWPRKTREVLGPIMDSRRWNDFQFRDDDIVIGTWSKSGTTWMQQVVSQLVFDGDAKVMGQAQSPWIDFLLSPEARAQAAGQTHRRFMKTHLPLDALVFSRGAKYIYVGRDVRDVVWSFHHHLSSFTPLAHERLEKYAAEIGSTPPPPGLPDVRTFYNVWLEMDAHSDNSFWKNVQGWWDARVLPNVLLVHYANMLADLPREFRRIAAFLDFEVDEAKLPVMLAHCSLSHMRDRAAATPFMAEMFEDEGRSFINKGTNARWRDVLSPEEAAKADAAAAANLTPDCAHWLRTGEMPEGAR